MIIGKKIWCSIHTIKATLLILELLSWMKVNFHKSLLLDVNVDVSWLNGEASMLNCKMDVLPFKYLGHPIGDHPRKLSFWNHIVY